MGQLYYRNLHSEIFDKYPKTATNLYIVSGYVGPHTVKQLKSLELNTTLIYGLQKENRKPELDSLLKKEHLENENVSILFSQLPSHSKLYVWYENNNPLRGLIGSANFSSNGLKNDFRETLIEVDKPDIYALVSYFNLIKDNSIECIDDIEIKVEPKVRVGDECELELYDLRSGEVPEMSGLNWGFSRGHVYKDDAYIRINKDHVKLYPDLFAQKNYKKEEGHRSRKLDETVELIWDDGTIMECLFEGTQEHEGKQYPKQIASVGRKRILGEYIRSRLGKPLVSKEKRPDERITRDDLERYGSSSIKISLISPGVYSASFKPRHSM